MSASKKPPSCAVCTRDPAQVNNERRECSVVNCPHRRVAWSERPTAEQHQPPRCPWCKAQGPGTCLDAKEAARCFWGMQNKDR